MGVQVAVPVALLLEVGAVIHSEGCLGRFRGLVVCSGHGEISVSIGSGACVYMEHPPVMRAP